MKNNEDKSICLACTNNKTCCETMGCHLSPKDLKEGVNFKSLKSLLSSGNYAVDWWEGDVMGEDRRGQSHYLRARNVRESAYCGSWGGVCVLLTDQGCSLSFSERPFGGKAVIPSKSGECPTIYSKEQSAKDWYQYNDLILDVVNRLDL